MTTVCATVTGIKPVPEGSMKAFPYRKKSGGMGVSMVHNKQQDLYKWRDAIADAFIQQNQSVIQVGSVLFPKGTPVGIEIVIYMVRPKTNKNLAPCGKVGDVDKEARSILDACTGIVYDDDCQVVVLDIKKVYDVIEGASVRIYDINSKEY